MLTTLWSLPRGLRLELDPGPVHAQGGPDYVYDLCAATCVVGPREP